MLAIKMSRLIIKATQPDTAVRERLRGVYAEDAGMLIAIGQTVATEFATIAAANNIGDNEAGRVFIPSMR